MRQLALTVALSVVTGALFAAPWREELRDGFDDGKLDPLVWNLVPDRATVPAWDARGGGKAVHFRSEGGDRGMVTALRPEPPYRLTFEFLQPAAEAGGYRLVVHHPSRYDNLWWLEVGSNDFAVWTTHLGGWAPRWTGDNLHPDTWYRVTIFCEPERVQVTIADVAGTVVAISDGLSHDDLPDPGGVMFGAHSGGGLRGAVFDNVRLETQGGTRPHRVAAPVEQALQDAVTAAEPDHRSERLVLRTDDGLYLELDGNAAARRLDLQRASLLPRGPQGQGGFYVWETDGAPRYERFTGRAELAQGSACDLRCVALGLRLTARFRATADRITVTGELKDTTVRDRPLVLVWVLPLEATGWTWGDSLLASRPIGETGRYHSSPAFGLGGAQGRHLLAPFPWQSLTSGNKGLVVTRPLDETRLISWSYDHTPQLRFLAVRVELGLSPATGKFPGRADFRFDLSVLPRAKWGMRAAAQRYYELYPDLFTRRVKTGQEGLWTLWVTTQVAQPEDFALMFHEQEPYSEDRVVFDDASGALSFTYAEPNTLWQRCTNWEAGKLQLDGFMDALRQRASQPASVLSDYPFYTQPMPVPDAELAQAALQSFIGRENQPTSYWSAPPDRIALNCNSDPELPRPNRASLWFDYEGVPALTDPRVDGAYIDSVGWSAFDAAENFRREHWATADIPLVPSFHRGGVAQLAGFAHIELYQAIAEAMHARGKLTLANTFPYTHLFTAHLFDVLGAGEGADLEAFHDPARLSFCRALAYHKPVSHMNYAYFHPDTPPEARERGLQRNLLYGVWPGSGNVGDPAQIEPLRTLYRRYMPLFRALTSVGWEPITEASAQPEQILVERFGQLDQGPLYLVVHNPTAQPSRATVRLQGALAKAAWPATIRDEVTGEELRLTRGTLAVSLKPWQTAMVALRHGA